MQQEMRGGEYTEKWANDTVLPAPTTAVLDNALKFSITADLRNHVV